MPLSPAQRQHVLDSIDCGHLRLDAPTKMSARYGAGQTCSGCKDTIGPADVEYEAEFADAAKYQFHLGCAGLWHAERQRREEAAGGERTRVMERSEAVVHQILKNDADLRDPADVASSAVEALIDKARRARRHQ